MSAPSSGHSRPEEREFRAIYQSEFTYVWHSVRRLGGRDADLEDLVHDVFVIFYRSLEKFDRARPIRPWLFGIAFRVVSDYRRKASFSREVAASERPVADDRPLPLEELEAKQRRELVRDALETLDMDQRAVFVMYELQGHSVVEIAATLNVKENTLYSRLRLARKKFAANVRRLQLRRGGA